MALPPLESFPSTRLPCVCAKWYTAAPMCVVALSCEQITSGQRPVYFTSELHICWWESQYLRLKAVWGFNELRCQAYRVLGGPEISISSRRGHSEKYIGTFKDAWESPAKPVMKGWRRKRTCMVNVNHWNVFGAKEQFKRPVLCPHPFHPTLTPILQSFCCSNWNGIPLSCWDPI